MKRFGTSLLILCLLGSSLIPSAAAGNNAGLLGKFPDILNAPAFHDVPNEAWYAKSVDACYRMGLMTGTGEETFSPNTQMTMAQVLVVCAHLHNRLNGGEEMGKAPADWRKTALLDEQGSQALTLKALEYTSLGRDDTGNYVKVGFAPTLLSPLDGKTITLSSCGTVLGISLPIDADSGFIQFSKETDEEIQKITDAIYHNTTGIPDWAMDAVYYLDTQSSPIYFSEYELNSPATRNQLIRALEDVLPAEALQPLGDVSSPPDVDLDAYWISSNSSGTTTDGNIGAFYRAGILAGTDQYGTYNGNAILDRAQLATILRAVVLPETRTLPVLKEYDQGVEYTLTPLSPPEEYNWRYRSGSYLAKVENQYLFTYADPTLLYRIDGTLIQCEEDFSDRYSFLNDGLAVVSKQLDSGEYAYGVIDQNGKTVLSCLFFNMSIRHDGILLAQKTEGGPWLVFDREGKPTGQSLPSYCLGDYGVSENRVIYQDPDTELYGFMDLDGNVTVPAVYSAVGSYSQGRAPVCNQNRVGFVDLDGQVVIPIKYGTPFYMNMFPTPFDLIVHFSFQDGMVVLTDPYTQKQGVVDLDGNVIFPFQLTYPEQGGNGWFHKDADYFNADGRRFDISLFCGDSSSFDQNYAIIFDPAGSFGYLDETGRIAIPVQFSQAGPIYDNKALVKKDGQWYRLEIISP